MASLTVTLDRAPGTGRWRKHARSAASAVAGAAKAVARPHKASLARLWDMPLTVVGAGFIDFSAFHVVHGLGWLVTGASLLLIEHLIADDEDTGRYA